MGVPSNLHHSITTGGGSNQTSPTISSLSSASPRHIHHGSNNANNTFKQPTLARTIRQNTVIGAVSSLGGGGGGTSTSTSSSGAPTPSTINSAHSTANLIHTTHSSPAMVATSTMPGGSVNNLASSTGYGGHSSSTTPVTIFGTPIRRSTRSTTANKDHNPLSGSKRYY